jgi:hypothetical protein
VAGPDHAQGRESGSVLKPARQRLWLTADGIFGPKTLQALRRALGR